MKSTNISRNFRLAELFHCVPGPHKAGIIATSCVYCLEEAIKLMGNDY
jgi:hypothetical protein